MTHSHHLVQRDRRNRQPSCYSSRRGLLARAGSSLVRCRTVMIAAAAMAVGLMGAANLSAQSVTPGQPGGLSPQRQAELKGVGVGDPNGKQLPLDLTFTDSTGKKVKLGDYFHHGRPVLVDFVYFTCPMLCTVSLDGVADVMNKLNFQPGKDYDIVTISFDPRDDPAGAAAKLKHYAERLGKPGIDKHWAFLTSHDDKAPIQAATDAAAFHFRWVPQQNTFAHSAALYVMTEDGKFSQTLKSFNYDPTTLRLAIVKASNGKVGTIVDSLICYCFSYDPSVGKYGPDARNIMKAGGALTLFLLIFVIVAYRVKEKRRLKKSTLEHEHVQPDAA